MYRNTIHNPSWTTLLDISLGMWTATSSKRLVFLFPANTVLPQVLVILLADRNSLQKFVLTVSKQKLFYITFHFGVLGRIDVTAVAFFQGIRTGSVRIIFQAVVRVLHPFGDPLLVLYGIREQIDRLAVFTRARLARPFSFDLTHAFGFLLWRVGVQYRSNVVVNVVEEDVFRTALYTYGTVTRTF